MKRGMILIAIAAAALYGAKVKPAGRIFGYYSNTLSDPDSTKVGYNEFGISRAYLDLKADFMEANEEETPPFQAKAKITYDAEPLNNLVRITPDPADSTPPSVSVSGLYAGFLKFAYGEIGAFRGMPASSGSGLARSLLRGQETKKTSGGSGMWPRSSRTSIRFSTQQTGALALNTSSHPAMALLMPYT